MAEELYIYAVARIRSRELLLLNSDFIEQLMAAKSYEECLRLLTEKGWGGKGHTDVEQMLSEERDKAWALMEELVEDMSVFDILRYPNDYQNLKTAIKLVYAGKEGQSPFVRHGTVNSATIMEAVQSRDFSLLPEKMRDPAGEAYEALMHTGDGQLCDRIVDKAALEAIHQAGTAQGNEFLGRYAEQTVAQADIRIAVRAWKTGKSPEWTRNALAACDTLDVEALAWAAESGLEEICEYLRHTVYAEGVPDLEKSLSTFELWCDNHLIREIRPEKYHSFTVSPLAAYLLARENEIKTVRIILLGRQNRLSKESIRERIREMYV